MGVSLFYLREKRLSANVYKLFVSLGMNTNDFTKALQDSKTEGKKGGEDIASSMMNSLKNNVVKLASSLAIGATLKKSITDAMDFTDSMAKMSTLFDTTKYSVSNLSKEFVGLSNETGKSATELAEAGYQALSASVPMEKLTDFTRTATNLAKVGFTDAATSVDILTTAMNAYGEKAGTAEQIANKLVLTQNLGKTTVAELASNMGRTIPTANAMGVSIDNLTASYAFMTKQGVNTQIATTQLNAMFNELGDSGTTVAKIIKEKTGQSFKEFMEDGHTLSDALKVLQEYSNDTGTAFNELWGSAEAGKAGLSLTNEEAGNFNEIVKEMGENTSVLGEGLEKLATPQAKLNKAMNVGHNMMILFGETILGTVAPSLDSFTNIMTTVADAMSNSSNIFQTLQILGNDMTNWFAGDGLTMMVQSIVNFVSGILTQISLSFPTVGIDMITNIVNGILGSIGTVLTALSSLVEQGLALLVLNAPKFMLTAIEFVGQLAIGISNNLPQFINSLVDLASKGIAILMQHLPDFLLKGVEIVTKIASGIIKNLPAIVSAILNGIIKLISTITSNLPQFMAKGGEIVAKLAIGIVNSIWNVAQAVTQIVTTIAGKIGGLPGMALQWGKDLIQSFVNGIKSMIGGVVNAVSGVAKKVANFLHFSEPDEGPLANFHTYAPDMMKLFAQGIRQNSDLLEDAFNDSLGFASDGIHTKIDVSELSENDSKKNRKSTSSITINVYPSQGMDIDELVEELMIKLEKARKKEEEVFA